MQLSQLYNRLGAEYAGATGVDALPLTFTYNGTDATAVCAFRGTDATATTWPAAVGGTNLAEAGAGSAMTLTTFPLGGGAVQFAGGKWMSGGDNYDISAGLFLMEIVFEPGTGGIVGGKAPGSTGVGYHWNQNGTTDYRGRFENSGGGRNAIDTTSDFTGWKYHVAAFDDVNDVLVSYDSENGITSTRSDFTFSGTYGNADNFAIGAFGGDASQFDGAIAWLAVYEPANLDLSATTDLVAACEARVTAMGGTPGSALA